jgi:flagellar biosynthesis/type III secretory pathway chaperone
MINGADPFDELTQVLSAQAEELRRLVPLLDEQQRALTRADSAQVASLMFRQAPIMKRLLQLDQRRQALAIALAARAGLSTHRVSLSALLARLPAAPAVLATLQVELRQLVDGIAVRTRRNAFLLERAVAYIEGLVRIVMAPVTEPAPVYAATGQPAGRQTRPRVLDRNA